MSEFPRIIPPNSVLATNSSIVEASRLIESTDPSNEDLNWRERLRPNPDIRRLAEFCAVTEAVVLNDTIYTLPSEDPDDFSDNSLLAILRAAGICRELPSVEISQKAVESVQRLLGRIGNSSVYQEAIPFIDGKMWLPGLDAGELPQNIRYPEKHRVRKYGPRPMNYRSYFMLLAGNDVSMHTRRHWDNATSRNAPSREDLMGFLASFRKHLNTQVSPNTSYVIHAIRDILYWATAEHFRMPYSPDLLRVEWTSAWLNVWRQSLTREVYSIVAEAFQASADEVLSDSASVNLSLPVISAAVLERAKSNESIPKALLSVRKDFKSFRSHFADLEIERHSAKSLSERRKVKQRLRSLFDSISNRSSFGAITFSFEDAVGYTDDFSQAEKYDR